MGAFLEAAPLRIALHTHVVAQKRCALADKLADELCAGTMV
jgi:hypothetical protein